MCVSVCLSVCLCVYPYRCQAALPKKEEAKGLKKYWADGKRELDESELSQLDEEDKDIYTGVTSSYILCHISIHTMSHHHTG